jgi:hypothetical protein
MDTSYEVAVVIEKKGFNEVQAVLYSDDENELKAGETIVKLSYLAFRYISNSLMDGMKVYLPIKSMYSEITPLEVMVSEDDPSLEDYIFSSRARARTVVSPLLAKISGFTLYNFTMLNNMFSSKGFFIYDDNKQDVYLKILETGDDGLIDRLEEFLGYKDEIDRVAYLERKLSKFNLEINDCEDFEEVIDLENAFLEGIETSLR